MSRHRPVPVAPRPFLVALRVVASRPLTVPSLSPSASSPPVPPFASHFRPVASPVASCPLTVASPSPSVSSPPRQNPPHPLPRLSSRPTAIADARTNDEGHAERVDRNAWLQESGRGPGAKGGNHHGGRVFRSPEERGRRCDERGRWLAFGEQSRGQGRSSGSVARKENLPHNAVREETPEQGVEDKEEGSGRSDEEAGIEGANEARTGETGDAKTEPAEAQAETSPVAVSELEAPPRGSRGRDDPYEEGRHTESSGRQELGGPEMSHQAWQAPNSRGKGKEERSRSAERERRLGGGRVGEFRPRDERQEQGEWSGGASHSAGRAAARGERVRGGNSVAEVARSAARGTQQHHTLARPD
ncbi:unnamed protein product [Closterium sp. NIES-64]|nr:unnamed protein product [Closterium sp. NIES-64]